MAPTPTQSLSNEDVVSKIQANPSFTYGGGGAGAGAGAPKQTPVDTRPQYSTPGQGVWPGLVSCTSVLFSACSPAGKRCAVPRRDRTWQGPHVVCSTQDAGR